MITALTFIFSFAAGAGVGFFIAVLIAASDSNDDMDGWL